MAKKKKKAKKAKRHAKKIVKKIKKVVKKATKKKAKPKKKAKVSRLKKIMKAYKRSKKVKEEPKLMVPVESKEEEPKVVDETAVPPEDFHVYDDDQPSGPVDDVVNEKDEDYREPADDFDFGFDNPDKVEEDDE